MKKIFYFHLNMKQETYNNYCDKIDNYKKLNFKNKKFNNYLYKIEKLLDHEYKYGSGWLDIYYLSKYLNKCKQIVNLQM